MSLVGAAGDSGTDGAAALFADAVVVSGAPAPTTVALRSMVGGLRDPSLRRGGREVGSVGSVTGELVEQRKGQA
jgi:hypothetical protein